ncbi:hypothetical protein HD806DRAFT_508817 [Xylariaceae sp. AK1471]|nr:hypothetical protein HD806DRAFT_508817 [Xylariaceae sp. AK1471]
MPVMFEQSVMLLHDRQLAGSEIRARDQIFPMLRATSPINGVSVRLTRSSTIIHHHSISGLVVKSIVAIDGPRVRFTADA